MVRPLENMTIGILEHRFTKEFSALLQRYGADVYACPLLEEKPVENRQELEGFVRQVAAGKLDLMIFLTGVGAQFLVSAAKTIGLKEEFLQGLNKMTIVVRGPKPVGALRQFGVRSDVIPDNPTTEGVIEALQPRNLSGSRVGYNFTERRIRSLFPRFKQRAPLLHPYRCTLMALQQTPVR